MEWFSVLLLFMIAYYVFMFFRHKLSIGGYNDRHVLITGCDTGFGHLLALRLDEMGFHVFAGCLTEKGEDELRKKASNKLNAFRFDVTQESSLKNALKFVMSKLSSGKGLWGVVNNAGIIGPGSVVPVEWLRKVDYEKTLAVNLYGPVETTRVFLPLVRKEKGRVVIMTSVVGVLNTPGDCAYPLSKHAVESYANTLRMSARMYGVSVHTIRPTGFATPITNHQIMVANVRAAWQRLDPELQTFYGQEYCDITIQIITDLMTKVTENPDTVVQKYVHALTARYPRTHYRVGWGANHIFRVLEWIPPWISDYLWTKVSPTPVGAIS